MATDTASTRTRRDHTRNLWQWPVFLAGAALFGATWQGVIPIGPPNPLDQFRRQIDSLRAAADVSNPDTAALNAMIQKLTPLADQFPDQASLSHYTIGSAFVRLGDTAAVPAQAHEMWNAASRHLEQVTVEKLPKPAEDGPRLTFRLAKARSGAGLPADTPNETLGQTARKVLRHPPVGEQSGEACQLAGDLFMRLTPPSLKEAKESYEIYLTNAGLATPSTSLARGKLRLSETLLALNEIPQARDWLTQIGEDAPAEVLVPAKAQLARIHMKEGAWADAAKQWEQVRAASGLPPVMQAQSAYHLAVCRQMTQQPDLAAKLFEEAARSESPERFAAVVKLADLTLRGPDAAAHKMAAEQLAAAVNDLPATEFANPLLPLNEVQATFEQAVQTLQADGAFEAAVKTTDAYAKVAVPGRDREKRAEVFAGWAEAVQKQNGDFKPKFVAAANEYVSLANIGETAASAKADRLRRASVLFRKAGDRTATRDTLRQLVQLPEVPEEIAGTAWVEYAEELLENQQWDEALKAFQQGLLHKTGATSARFKLARRLIDSGDPVKLPLGMELLKQIASTQTLEPNEQEYRERALVELGQDALKAGRFSEAETQFRKQLGFNPAGPEANLARFLLGVCLLQQTTRTAGTNDKPDAEKMRKEALDLFKGLVSDVDSRKTQPPGLSESDLWLRTQSSLRILQALQQMERLAEVVGTASVVRRDCEGKVEELIALSMMYHAQKQLNRPELALRVLDDMRAVYARLPDAAFHGTTGEYSKDYWDRVWFNPPPADASPMPLSPKPAPKPAPSPIQTPTSSPTPVAPPAPVPPLVPISGSAPAPVPPMGPLPPLEPAGVSPLRLP